MPLWSRRNGLSRNVTELWWHHHWPQKDQRTHRLAQNTEKCQRSLKSPWNSWLPMPLYPKLRPLCQTPHIPVEERCCLWMDLWTSHITRHPHQYCYIIPRHSSPQLRLPIQVKSGCISVCHRHNPVAVRSCQPKETPGMWLLFHHLIPSRTELQSLR